jgi:hypothetical protein
MSPTISQLAGLVWHLEYNFYPPMDSRLAPACMEAIAAATVGDPDRIISINGQTRLDGEDITAQSIMDDLRLWDFVPDRHTLAPAAAGE